MNAISYTTSANCSVDGAWAAGYALTMKSAHEYADNPDELHMFALINAGIRVRCLLARQAAFIDGRLAALHDIAFMFGFPPFRSESDR